MTPVTRGGPRPRRAGREEPRPDPSIDSNLSPPPPSICDVLTANRASATYWSDAMKARYRIAIKAGITTARIRLMRYPGGFGLGGPIVSVDPSISSPDLRSTAVLPREHRIITRRAMPRDPNNTGNIEKAPTPAARPSAGFERAGPPLSCAIISLQKPVKQPPQRRCCVYSVSTATLT